MKDNKFDYDINSIEELIVAYIEDTLFPIVEYNRLESQFICDSRGRWVVFENEYEKFMEEFMEERIVNLLEDWGIPDMLYPYIDMKHFANDLWEDVEYEEWITKESVLKWLSNKCNDFVEQFEGEDYEKADESASEFYEEMSDLLKSFEGAYIFS